MGDLILPPGAEMNLPKFLPLVELESSYADPVQEIWPMAAPGKSAGNVKVPKKVAQAYSKFRPQYRVHHVPTPQITQLVELSTNPASWFDFYIQPGPIVTDWIGNIQYPMAPSGDYSKWEYYSEWEFDYFTSSFTEVSGWRMVFDQFQYDMDWMSYEFAVTAWEISVAHENAMANLDYQIAVTNAELDAHAQYEQLILDIKQKDANFSFVISEQKHNFARSSDPTQPYKRNDSKLDSAGRGIYNRFLKMVNRTYGAADEGREFFMAITNNIYAKDGGKLHHSPWYRLQLLTKGEAELNMVGFAKEFVFNQFEDVLIGIQGRTKRSASLNLDIGVGKMSFTKQILKNLLPTPADVLARMPEAKRTRWINRNVHKLEFKENPNRYKGMTPNFLQLPSYSAPARTRLYSERRPRVEDNYVGDPVE
jgi:hypothetical protein